MEQIEEKMKEKKAKRKKYIQTENLYHKITFYIQKIKQEVLKLAKKEN